MIRACWIEFFFVVDFIGLLWDIHLWIPTFERWLK
jgi:hypothetical protein